MPRGRYKRRCVVATASRAPKRNRADAQILPIVEAVQETNDNETQEEVVEEKNEPELTAEEVRAVCEALIKQTFNAIGMDIDSHLACFRACVGKATSTGMVYATNCLEAADATVSDDQTYKVKVSHTITRQEAQQALQSIIEPLRELDTPESSLFDHLTLPRLKVLPVGDKRSILWWIKDIDPEIFAEWRRETEQDIEQYQWTETVKGTLPETWTDHPADTVFRRIEERAKTDPDPSSIKDLALLKEIFKDQERHGMDPIFSQKMSQWMLRMEHKADEQAAAIDRLLKKLDLVDGQSAEQAATSAKVLKRLDFVLDKLNKVSEPMTEGAEPCHSGDSVVDFADAKSLLFIDE
ncbi:hypothetical protein ACHAPE_001067 [Trichoderma viride]